MKDMMRSEFYKIWKSRITWVTFFIFLGIAALRVMTVTYAKMKSGDWEMILRDTGISVFSSYPSGTVYLLLIALFVSNLVSLEYTTGTVKQVVSRGIPRSQIAIGQYVTLCVSVTVITLIPALVLMGAYSLAWGFGGISAGRFLIVLIGQNVVMWSYVAFSMLIAHITRSGGFSVGINLIFLFLGSMASSIISILMEWDWVREYWFVNMQGEAVNYTLGLGRQCKFILLLFIGGAVCAGLGVLLFDKRDVQ